MKQNWCYKFGHECKTQNCDNCGEYDCACIEQQEQKEYEKKIHVENGFYDK